jgi:hypothetical protein
MPIIVAMAAATGCQRQKVGVEESPEPRSPEWDSGLSVELELDVATAGDQVEVVAVATATNATTNTRDLCVNLHFVAGFREAHDDPSPNDSAGDQSAEFKEIPDSLEIATSPWKKDGKTNCTPRTLEPGTSFQERFQFEYAKTDFAGREGDVVVMCQIWFQTRLDIPNRSLTCDLDHFAYERVPVR